MIVPGVSADKPQNRPGLKSYRPGSDYSEQNLPRKEVIHAQLPLRMPCYDLVLITDPAMGLINKDKNFRHYQLS